MTIVPLTQGALRLGIDAKTLRRWLTDAQIPLHPDPHDARTKGVHLEHLHLLAQIHQRHLTPSSADPSAPDDAPPAPLHPALLALPETLASLQQQISALQQQVATLTHLLQQPPAPPPVPSATPAQMTPRPAAWATPPTPKLHPVAKVPSKPVHVIPRVEYGTNGRYVITCPKKGRLPFEPDSPQWFDWVKEQDSFRFVGRCGHFSAHHEWRVPKGAWRAHRKIRNQTHVLRLAPNQDLTIDVLEHAAQTLQSLL